MKKFLAVRKSNNINYSVKFYKTFLWTLWAVRSCNERLHALTFLINYIIFPGLKWNCAKNETSCATFLLESISPFFLNPKPWGSLQLHICPSKGGQTNIIIAKINIGSFLLSARLDNLNLIFNPKNRTMLISPTFFNQWPTSE